MEWYLYDDSLRRDSVIEGYESFIWTERYTAWGDFQIVTASNPDSKNFYKIGTRIGRQGSPRIMRIESILDTFAEDGKKYLTVSGRSVEHFLDDRCAMPALIGTNTTPKWVLTGTPGAIARYMFQRICVDGILNSADTLEGYHSGTLLPSGNIPEPSDSFTMEFEPDTLYNSIKQVCEIWLLGFRLVKDGDTGNIYFEIYTGSNRTSGQSTLPAVIFSLDMENIDKTSLLRSIADIKNVAYVFSPNGCRVVYSPGADSSTTMGGRRVLTVNATDITYSAGTEPQFTNALVQRGLQELAKWREVYVFDGEVSPDTSYVYEKDYFLGDLVEERGPDGVGNYMFVTEQIFVSDAEGERSYPTLTLNNVLVPGTWVARSGAEHWSDVDPAQHWGDL
jgi:hypothetical protein